MRVTDKQRITHDGRGSGHARRGGAVTLEERVFALEQDLKQLRRNYNRQYAALYAIRVRRHERHDRVVANAYKVARLAGKGSKRIARIAHELSRGRRLMLFTNREYFLLKYWLKRRWRRKS